MILYEQEYQAKVAAQKRVTTMSNSRSAQQHYDEHEEDEDEEVAEAEEDDNDDDEDESADTLYATSSSVSPYSSSDEQAIEHNYRNQRQQHNHHQHSHSPSQPPTQHRPTINPAYPLDPSQPPPLSAIPTLLRSNASFMSDYGPLRMSIAAFGLGCGVAGGVGLAVVLAGWGYGWSLGAYVSCWCLFHWLEYVMTGVFHPHSLCFTSFLLNHSRAFHIALAASLVEYCVEALLVPAWKQSWWLSYAALAGVLLFQSLRSLSMYHGSTNFTHIISHTAAPTHHLITGGLYAVSRHPSYTAWLGWSVCTQLLLCNPVCAIGFAVVGWQFFQRRIEYEERTLCSFFGRQYEEYVRRVWVGIPLLVTSTERRCRAMPTTTTK